MIPISVADYVKKMTDKKFVESVEQEDKIQVVVIKANGQWYLVLPQTEKDAEELFGINNVNN